MYRRLSRYAQTKVFYFHVKKINLKKKLILIQLLLLFLGYSMITIASIL